MVKKAERIAQQARQACEKWRQYFDFNIKQYHEMHDFVMGRQWNDDEEDMLKTYKKIPLQFNKLATLINTLLGEQQQNTPQLEVAPLANCSEEVAAIREAITKDLILGGNSKTVYQVAAAEAFIGGFGCFVIGTEYSHSNAFELDIKYYAVKDATRAYWDVSAERVNKTDGMCAGYLSRMSRKRFAELYGKHIEQKISSNGRPYASKEEVALATDTNASDDPFNWADEDAITINDYYVRSFENHTIYKLSNQKVVNQDELDEIIEKSREINFVIEKQQQFQMGEEAALDSEEGEEGEALEVSEEAGEEDFEMMTLWDEGMPVRIEDKRTQKKAKVRHYKIAGDYILEDSEFPSEHLPVVFVDQNSYYNKDGQQICRPFVIDAIDAQRYLNYLGTQSAYILKVSRYDQFIGSKKNVASNDTQQVWRDPASIQGLLTYDESPNGHKPEQLRPPELSQSLITQYQRAIEDMYTSTGLYPTRLGQAGNEVSGAAIDARTRQGSYSTYVAFNSINRAIAAGGEVVNEMIPKVYDSERVITLLTPYEGQRNIVINRQVDEYGEVIENDIRKGTFEVRLLAGPSYEGQKQEALNSLNMILQANPQLMNLVADLYAENLPLMNTIELKNRLKTIVPPEIIEAGKTGRPVPPQQGQPSPEEQAAMIEMQAKQKQLELKEKELQLKAEKQQAETEREIMRLQTERLEVAAQLEEQKLRYMAETHRTRSNEEIAHADNLTKILTHKVS